jgi:hypothetical protein
MKRINIATLSRKWHDTDEVLLHAAFQLIVDFVEKERPDKVTDWSSDEAHRQAWKEIKRLYRWWKHIRPTRRSPLDDKKIKRPPLKRKIVSGSKYIELVQPDRKKYAEYYTALRRHTKLEVKWYEEDQLNLHKLIDVRRFLWT